MPVRKSEAVWHGTLKEGGGTMRLASGLYEGPYTFSSRFEEAAGTNPEELVGAAHAGCFSMFLAALLTDNGHPPESVHTTAVGPSGRGADHHQDRAGLRGVGPRGGRRASSRSWPLQAKAGLPGVEGPGRGPRDRAECPAVGLTACGDRHPGGRGRRGAAGVHRARQQPGAPRPPGDDGRGRAGGRRASALRPARDPGHRRGEAAVDRAGAGRVEARRAAARRAGARRAVTAGAHRAPGPGRRVGGGVPAGRPRRARRPEDAVAREAPGGRLVVTGAGRRRGGVPPGPDRVAAQAGRGASLPARLEELARAHGLALRAGERAAPADPLGELLAARSHIAQPPAAVPGAGAGRPRAASRALPHQGAEPFQALLGPAAGPRPRVERSTGAQTREAWRSLPALARTARSAA